VLYSSLILGWYPNRQLEPTYEEQHSGRYLPDSGDQADRCDGDATPDAKENGH